MISNITEQISIIRKDQAYRLCEYINLQGLVDLVTTHLSRADSSPVCHTISLLGWGSHNIVHQLAFSDGTQLAASVSKHREEDFNAQARLSEIETMKFVRESGLYPDVPVPKGDNLQGLRDEEKGLFGFDTLPYAQQPSIVKAMAKLQASLSKPVPFDKIGSIAAGGCQFQVGPLMTITQQCLGGPFKSVYELWHSCLEGRIVHAAQEWCSLEKDELPLDFSFSSRTPQEFAELYQLLSSLIPQFMIPQASNQLVLHHPDLALRNIFFDKESLLSDEPKITGVIDWGGAQILPLMLTAMYPDDLRTESADPYSRSDCPGQDWNTVPFDWTSTGDRSRIPTSFRGVDLVPIDFVHRARAMVRRFYLREYFSAYYAKQLHILYGNTDLARAMVFRDAPYYLKFHETVCGGLDKWFYHREWIIETYWRLRGLSDRGTAERLVIGPNAYRKLMGPVVQDLGIFEKPPQSQNAEDFEDQF